MSEPGDEHEARVIRIPPLRLLRAEDVIDPIAKPSHLPTTDCMVDIETLGREPGAVVLSIGAVMFAAGKVGEIGQRYMRAIDMQDSARCGLTVDAATLTWWLRQPEDTRAFSFEGTMGLKAVLREFAAWVEGCGAETMWANAPTFDCAILRGAYKAANVRVPWHWRGERDCRTLWRVATETLGMKFTPEDAVGHTLGLPSHHPLEDAYRQARGVQAVVARMKGVA